MDSESFEIYVMKKGYTFSKIENDENKDGIIMEFWDGDVTRYITWYSKNYEAKQSIDYQSTEDSELIEIYEELKLLGYKLSDREDTEEYNKKTYYNFEKDLEDGVYIYLSKLTRTTSFQLNYMVF